MTKNLNENIYKRFGLDIDKQNVESGFRKYFANKIWDVTYPLRFPDQFNEKYVKELYQVRESILDDCCREMFLDRNDYKYNHIYEHRDVSKFIDHVVRNSFEEVLLKMQILINVLFKYDVLHEELEELTSEILKYTNDFPILGITIKIYKTKAPQILPSRSKYSDNEIVDTLGVLDAEVFHDVLNDFEATIKSFAKAKTDSDMKAVIASAHGACDEVVKVILNNKGKSFKSVTDKDDHKILGLNGDQKEIFKHLKNRMDTIKHGSTKNIDRNEVEMIISVAASFIRFVALKYNEK